MYADVEQIVIEWLDAHMPGVGFGTDTPADLAGACPFGQVTRYGGYDDVLTLDQADVDVDWYETDGGTPGSARGAVSDLARQGHVLLRTAFEGYRAHGVVVARVATIAAPAWRPWDDLTVRRFGAAYRITFHG